MITTFFKCLSNNILVTRSMIIQRTDKYPRDSKQVPLARAFSFINFHKLMHDTWEQRRRRRSSFSVVICGEAGRYHLTWHLLRRSVRTCDFHRRVLWDLKCRLITNSEVLVPLLRRKLRNTPARGCVGGWWTSALLVLRRGFLKKR